MAFLKRASGELIGQLIELKEDRTLIGRSPEHCHVVLDPNGVSRKHAEIHRTGDEYYLADLNSRNSTKVNNVKVVPGADHHLRSGDRISICDLEFLFYLYLEDKVSDEDTDPGETLPQDSWTSRGESGESWLARVMVDHRSTKAARPQLPVPGPGSPIVEDSELGKFVKLVDDAGSERESLSEECSRIRGLLETNHVKWDHAEQRGLIDEVLKPGSPIKDLLGEGFHRLVVLDASWGIGPEGAFDDHRFLEALRAGIVQAFGLPLDGTAFHIEDIFQMLKDEQRSLICFVNFQLIPSVHFRTLRGFTQGIHRVLLLTRGSRDVAREEGLV
jgi:pSer/pThr/pTyr-binding forkhead associated (FHA) protein